MAAPIPIVWDGISAHVPSSTDIPARPAPVRKLQWGFMVHTNVPTGPYPANKDDIDHIRKHGTLTYSNLTHDGLRNVRINEAAGTFSVPTGNYQVTTAVGFYYRRAYEQPVFPVPADKTYIYLRVSNPEIYGATTQAFSDMAFFKVLPPYTHDPNTDPGPPLDIGCLFSGSTQIVRADTGDPQFATYGFQVFSDDTYKAGDVIFPGVFGYEIVSVDFSMSVFFIDPITPIP